MSRWAANGLLLLTAAIWGFAFVAQRVSTEHVGAFTFNGTRFLLGAAILVPVAWAFDRARRRNGGWKRWRAAALPGAITGAVLFAGSTLQQLGIAYTTAGKAAFITGLYMVLVPLMGIALGHRAHRNAWIGVALAVGGLYLLTVREFTISLGDGLELIGAFFWAAHILVIDRFSPRLDPLRYSVWQFATAGALSLLVAPVGEPDPYTGIAAAAIPILYAGLLSTGVAYTVQVIAQRHARPHHAAIILAMESLFGAIGGWLFLSEGFTVRGGIGVALMMAGILVSQWEPTAPRGDDAPPAAPPDEAARTAGAS